MQLKVSLTESEFKSGKILDIIEPPILEFKDQKGWTRRAEIADIDKLSQFSGVNKQVLLALLDTMGNFVG